MLQLLPSKRSYGPSLEGRSTYITRGARCISGVDEASTELKIPDSAMDTYSQRMRMKESTRLAGLKVLRSRKRGDRSFETDTDPRIEDLPIVIDQGPGELLSWYGSKKRRSTHARRVRTIEVSTNANQCVRYGDALLDPGDTLLAYATRSKRGNDLKLADETQDSNSADEKQNLATNFESIIPPVQQYDDDLLPDITDFDDIDWGRFDEDNNPLNSLEIDLKIAKSSEHHQDARNTIVTSQEPQVSITYGSIPLSAGQIGQDPRFMACISLPSQAFEIALHAEVIPRSQIND